ncbi:MAG: DJ-1/PfpI family protein [Balneolaceae bacterium]|nr:DJ-1/PfpI family protein [Balneolaceae bacterium]
MLIATFPLCRIEYATHIDHHTKGHTSMVNIAGTHQIFSQVNGMRSEMGKLPVFDVHLVGLSKETRQSTGFYSVAPDSLIRDITKTDLIIIPAIHDDHKTTLKNNKEFIPWIVQHYKEGAEVASFCVGAFFLAATGLLNGKQCATHWMHANNFRELFPEVNLVDEKIMTEEDGIYTSGGAYAFLNLLLHLIEKHAGRGVANNYELTVRAIPFIIAGHERHTWNCWPAGISWM